MSRSTALLALAGSAGMVSLVVVLAAIDTKSPDQPTGARSAQNITIPRPDAIAPGAAVEPVHRALHVLGRVCRPGANTDQAPRATRAVSVILQFARRYPSVSFPLHDETGTTLSLLFVARSQVQSCAPQLTARVERLIPREYLTPNLTQ